MSARSRRTASSTGGKVNPAKLGVGDTQAGDVGHGAAVGDEHELVVPRPVRPVPVQHEQPTHPSVQSQLLAQLPRGGSTRRFVGFGHPTGQIPEVLVGRFDQQNPPGPVEDQHISGNPLARLTSVPLSRISEPGSLVVAVHTGQSAPSAREARASPQAAGRVRGDLI
jgi:hypothetical protein